VNIKQKKNLSLNFVHLTEITKKQPQFCPLHRKLQLFPKPCNFFRFFFVMTVFSTVLARIAYNVPAAWRSGGLHYRLGGRQTFIFALPFLRGYCRRCAKPPVVRRPFYQTNLAKVLEIRRCLVIIFLFLSVSAGQYSRGCHHYLLRSFLAQGQK